MRRLACLLVLLGGARGDDAATTAVARDTETLLAAIDAEVLARREGGRGAEADALAAEVDALRRRAAGAEQPVPSDLPEVHVVRLREAAGFLEEYQQRIRVRVTVTGRPAILLFTGQRPARWEVEAAAGTVVRRIFKAGTRQSVGGSRGRAEAIADDALVAAADGADLERIVEARVGARVRTVLDLDWSAMEGDALVLGPENPAWQTQHVHADALDLYWRSTRARRAAQREEFRKLRFPALCRWREGDDMRASLAEWTPLGPLLARQQKLPEVLAASSAAVKDEERGEIYLLREGVLVRYVPPKGPTDVLGIPDTLPQARERCALAIDTRRHRLLLATKHDHGYLYALDLASREWSVVNDLDDVDPAGMAYDAQRDAILCVAYDEGGTLRLHRFSAEEGRRMHETPLRVPRLGEGRPLAAACVNGQLVLLYPPPGPLADRTGEDTFAFVVEPHSGDVLFATRVRPWEDFEPLPETRIEGLWNDLVGKDEARIGKAMRSLAGQGDAAVAFLAKRFAPEPGMAEDLASWVRMLSDDDAMVRDLAQHALVEAGPHAVPYLAGLDLAALPPEARRRVGAALKTVGGAAWLQRTLRAVRVLEWIETPAAEALLEDLALKGDPGRASAARDALARMKGPRR